MSEVQLWIFYTLVPIAGLVLLALLVNAWLVPYRLMHERLDEAIATNKLQSDPKASRPDPVDVLAYEGTTVFQLGDAACLWVGIEPHNPIIDPQALAAFKRLSGAVMYGHLPGSRGLTYMVSAVSGHPMWPSYEDPVSAVDLRRYADRGGNVPPFLASVQIPDTAENRDEKAPTLDTPPAGG